jgi:hypothetical protein
MALRCRCSRTDGFQPIIPWFLDKEKSTRIRRLCSHLQGGEGCINREFRICVLGTTAHSVNGRERKGTWTDSQISTKSSSTIPRVRISRVERSEDICDCFSMTLRAILSLRSRTLLTIVNRSATGAEPERHMPDEFRVETLFRKDESSSTVDVSHREQNAQGTCPVEKIIVPAARN